MAKLGAFFESGVSMTEMLRACAVLRQPGDVGDAHEHVNVTTAMASDDQLAPVAQGSLQQFSLTCNHTCQAMRAAMHEVKCDNKVIAPNGFVNKALLETKDPNFANIFAFWDVVFGTYRVPGPCNVPLGFEGTPRHSYFKLMLWPGIELMNWSRNHLPKPAISAAPKQSG